MNMALKLKPINDKYATHLLRMFVCTLHEPAKQKAFKLKKVITPDEQLFSILYALKTVKFSQ